MGCGVMGATRSRRHGFVDVAGSAGQRAADPLSDQRNLRGVDVAGPRSRRVQVVGPPRWAEPGHYADIELPNRNAPRTDYQGGG
jgi:hypothetical protein